MQVDCAMCGNTISDQMDACPYCRAAVTPVASAQIISPRSGLRRFATVLGHGFAVLFAIVIALVALAELSNWRGLGAAPSSYAGSRSSSGDKDLTDAPSIKAMLAGLRDRRDWNAIDIVEAGGNSYSLKLWYEESASVTPGLAENDGKFLVRTILRWLVDRGRRPAAERDTVFATIVQHFNGETGERKVTWFGTASYDYNADQVTYRRCTGQGWFGC